VSPPVAPAVNGRERRIRLDVVKQRGESGKVGYKRSLEVGGLERETHHPQGREGER